jgi:hypothetical protein
MARGTYATRSQIVCTLAYLSTLPSLNSSVSSPSSQIQASSHEQIIVDIPSYLSLSSRPHWTAPVSREETLARREQFRKIGWRPPNHKPKTTKGITWAKSIWDRYVARDDLRYPSRIRARVTNSILFRHYEHLGVDPDPYLLASGPADFETFIDWILRTTKKKTHATVSQIWK